MREKMGNEFIFNQKGQVLTIDSPMIMGIINITPDSFYKGSRYQEEKNILARAEEMIREGADILDLGAMSSRPGADVLSHEMEWKRLAQVIPAIKSQWPDVSLSVDTLHAATAAKSLEAGVDWINDISGGTYDPDMESVVAEYKAPYVCMHMRGTPKTMKGLAQYEDVVDTIYSYFSQRIRQLRDQGIYDIVIDPGFGFAKNIDQNFQLLRSLHVFKSLGCPILVGLSRKSLIYKTLGVTPDEALNGSTVLHTFAVSQGANILRVHDVKEAMEVKILAKKMQDAGS